MANLRSTPLDAVVVVLVKDFESAKQRLSPALTPPERQRLARANARRAFDAARETGRPVLAVCGSRAAAEEAQAAGVEAILEAVPRGQNGAARTGIKATLDRGGEAVLLLSSDLPLVTADGLRRLLELGGADGERRVVAAAATGRGGTNALYLRPPDVIDLHFGDDSLTKFERDAKEHGVSFQVVEDPDLALDLDEPADLDALGAHR